LLLLAPFAAHARGRNTCKARSSESRLRPFERPVSSQTVLELVAHSSCTAYDCEFVAVAREQGVRLISADRQVLREFPHLTVSLNDFLAD